MPEDDKKMYRDLSLNTPISITLPAHTWFGFIASYSDADWNCGYASQIAMSAQKELLDPVFYREREAELSAAQDHQRAHMAQFFPGMPGLMPEVPPDLSGLQDGEQE